MSQPKSLCRSPPSTVTAATIVTSRLAVQTPGRGFVDLTAEIAKFVDDAHAREGAVNAVYPPYLGVADHPGKRRSHRA